MRLRVAFCSAVLIFLSVPSLRAVAQDQVVGVLKSVFDPEIPVNIYELGMVYKIDVEPPGGVTVKMTLTSPMCPVAMLYDSVGHWLIQLYGYEESHTHKSTFTGQEGADPPAPELVRIKKDDPNHAMKFDYSLRAPNQWAGVTVEIHGLPDVDGRLAPEDVSGYKTLSLQVYATGIQILRVETISGETGKDTTMQYPQKTFKVLPGFNTYKMPLTAFAQPAWVKDTRVDPKNILRKLTSIKLTAFCDQCELNQQGTVIVDNVVFEK